MYRKVITLKLIWMTLTFNIQCMPLNVHQAHEWKKGLYSIVQLYNQICYRIL